MQWPNMSTETMSRYEPKWPRSGISKLETPSKNYPVLLPSNMRLSNSLIQVAICSPFRTIKHEVLWQRWYWCRLPFLALPRQEFKSEPRIRKSHFDWTSAARLTHRLGAQRVVYGLLATIFTCTLNYMLIKR